MLKNIPQHDAVTGKNTIQQHKACPPRHILCQHQHDVDLSAQRKPIQQSVKYQLQKQRRPKGRQRNSAHGKEPAKMIQQLILFLGRIDAQRNTNRNSNDHGHQHKFNRRGNILSQLIGNRLFCTQRRTQVTVQQVIQI